MQIRDLGSPPLTSNQTFTIIITDRNDNAPQLVTPVNSYIFVNVPEDSEIGDVVELIDVIDIDLGVNRQLIFELDDYYTPGREHFSMTQFEFLPSPQDDIQRSELFVTGFLDFEQITFYVLFLTIYNPTPFEPLSIQPFLVSLLCHSINSYICYMY